MATTANPAPGFVEYPDRRIALQPLGDRVTVHAGDLELANSQDALVMREGDYPPVIYIPFDDIRTDRLAPTGSSTHCPFKGHASYWRIAGDQAGADVMWAYEAPYDEMAKIKGYAAFYGDRVSIETR
ncbi:MAG: DUF427 domain-containing protein [Rhizobiaceae bacterium]